MRAPIRFFARILPRLPLLPAEDDVETTHSDRRTPRMGSLRRRMIRIGPGLLYDPRTGSLLAL